VTSPNIKTYSYHNKQKTCYSFKNRVLVQDLISHGQTPCKTLLEMLTMLRNKPTFAVAKIKVRLRMCLCPVENQLPLSQNASLPAVSTAKEMVSSSECNLLFQFWFISTTRYLYRVRWGGRSLISSCHTPMGFSPQWCVVMNSHSTKPPLDRS